MKKKQHVWMVVDEKGVPVEYMGGIHHAYVNKKLAINSAIYYGSNDQEDYFVQKFVPEVKHE